MTGDEVRKAFLQFFEQKGHTVIPSSSLVPQDDPTLLLTSAGMVQVKPYFLGLAVPPNLRLASCQKCFRTSDVDSVGDNTHLTFFEMLGNFSVGDYFKKEAIDWAWEFVIQWLKLPPDRLWITVFLDDDEASTYWQETGVPVERIVRLGEEDNFWGPAGDSGPCGPCSEILYDFGEEFGCGKPDCGPACECDRFTEIWNLVFTQYDQDKEGKRTPLPKPNIDTGMGLERVAAIMQGKTSVYEADLFAPIAARIEALSGKEYGQDKAVDRAMRIVAEHGRAVTFLIADGVVPSNEGRGYVLRRVLRRASLFGRKLGVEEAFLTRLADVVVEKMGPVYPEVVRNKKSILKIIEAEETKVDERFKIGTAILENTILRWRDELKADFPTFSKDVQAVLVRGTMTDVIYDVQKAADNFQMGRAFAHILTIGGRDAIEEAQKPLNEAVENLRDAVKEKLKATDQPPEPFDKFQGRLRELLDEIERKEHDITQTISGFEAFILHDSYGFLIELTREVAQEQGISVDLDGFEQEMERQRERARAAHKFAPGDRTDLESYEQLGVSQTQFVGYEKRRHKSVVVGLVLGGKPVDFASEGDDVEVILKETPFYGEMGGQVGDTGEIRSDQGKVIVSQTIRPLPELMVHQAKVTEGQIAVNDRVEAEVDVPRRLDIARNHTATHLLQAALRAVLGEHVRQSGSLVAPDRFRFDFTHLESVRKDQLLEIQHIVNDKIRQNLPVVARHVSYDEAISKGAIALFGEKYGDTVRMVETGDPPFSTELCGGTHVSSTGEIGLFHITAEGSIGSGMRRIEAVTGRGAERFIEQRLSTLEMLAQKLEASPDTAQSKLSATLAELDRQRKRDLARDREVATQRADSLLRREVKVVDGINVISAAVPAMSWEAMREMGDLLKQGLGSGVVVLGTVYDDRPNFVAMVTPDLVAKGFHAGELVKQVAQICGGGGGGRPEMGQGSGRDKSKVDEALRLVTGLVSG